MANRMAKAIANRMAKLMQLLWQNDAPNPNPNPNPTPLADALVKVRSTLAESDTSASPIVKAVARKASTWGWRC